ncbi:MAG: Asp-tRNA(Asn)/Glu-tRNA(Gln) amidotransferase subunit GatC [Planctomycetota bacterium]
MLNPDEVRRLARLARLRVPDEALPPLAVELSKIVDLVDQLAEVPTDGVEPMVHAFDVQNVLAVDQVGESLSPAEALRNAPSHDGECFLVPPVLG